MSMEEVLTQLHQEAVDEANPFYVKPSLAGKYHIFYMSETPMRCKCGSYTLRNVYTEPIEGKPVSANLLGVAREVSVKVPPEEVAKACLHHHEREMDRRTQTRKEKLQGDLGGLGDKLIESVREQVFMYVLTLDTDAMGRFVDALANVVDSEVLRVLKKHKPEELEALIKLIGGKER